MGTYSPVSTNLHEQKDTRSEQFLGNGEIQASVELLVPSAEKDIVINDLIQNKRVYPHISASRPPTVVNVGAKPFYTDSPSVGQSYQYDAYILTVQYSTDPETDLVTESIEPDAEFQRLDHRWFRWEDNSPLTEGEAPGLLQRSLRLVRSFTGASVVPTEVVTKVGTVHDQNYTSSLLGLTFPKGTLLLTPAPVKRTITTAGSDGFNFSINWSYAANGWNKYWRPSVQQWQSLKLPDGTDYKSYPEENLSGLF